MSEILKEREQFELENTKNEIIDRFLYLSREAANIDNEMLHLCCELEKNFGIHMESAIDERRKDEMSMRHQSKLDMEVPNFE